MKNMDLMKTYGIIVVLLLLVIFFSLMTDSFFTTRNLFNILRQVSIIGIVSVGMTFVLLTGGIDLSVGSLIAVTGVTASTLMVTHQANAWFAMLVGILLVTALGFLTGLIVQKFELPPMIVTLGMMIVARGLAFLVTGGLPVFGLPSDYVMIGQGYLWVIPIPVIFMLVFFAIGKFILEQTCVGRHFYAMGGNIEAARLTGIRVARLKIASFAISGFLCGVAGIVLMFRINSGQPTAGGGLELDVITATVLGGVSLSGGEGRIAGVLVGCLIIGVLSNGLTIMNVGEYYRMVITGCVLVLAVILDKLGQRYSAKRAKAIAA